MEHLPFSGLIVLCCFLLALGLLIGWMWGNSKQGYKVYKTNELPLVHFSVIYKDYKRTLLTEIGPKGRDFLITSEAFGKKKIKIGDVVKHFTGTGKEMKALGVPILGYPPLVKVEEEVLETETISLT